ncbi:MAG TPA: AsnC family transcriptional regulator [Nocardioides sp.]|jgi:Lrp/AsnC family transcriptional regulator for asnA, asnC and gidA|uniref:Lrp/AsnC family transcriptional regulator n=1 Tax=Nocardioides sp. TaxID=35761 RepID=UPI002E37773B|nr:AsnC family transcriptional regulator [Nocardioides sp.]HEX3930751.1 AsnC family transcriptional regulator [Nocardioides sp.]
MSQPVAQPGRGDHIASSTRIDELDKSIIAILQNDGRCPYSTISDQVGISDAAVRVRVGRLRRDGVIQIVAVTDPLQLGFSHEALVAIRTVERPGPVADALAEIPEVDFVVLVAGAFDIMLEIVADSDEHFLALIGRIRELVGGGTVQVMPYLETRLQQYAWGVR